MSTPPVSESVALITGASSGIGRATGSAMADAGWSVVLVGRREAELKKTADQIGRPEQTLVAAADITDSAACNQVVDATLQRFGRLDALLNIAGFASMAPLAQTTDMEWTANLQTNVSAVFYLTRAAWPALSEADPGRIVNISSMAAIDPFPGFGAYAPAKAALNMLSRLSADEGGEVGIEVVTIVLGAVETPMLRSLFDTAAIGLDQTLDPAEVARRVRELVCGDQPFASGEVIQILS
jgi:3-oxoacyl-[acyl-carrier protein] reductase